MLLNRGNLDAAFTGFKTLFNEGLESAESQRMRVATETTSLHAEEKYGWLKELPGVREWLGDRHVHGLALGDYAIKNRDFELTIGVEANAISDDTYGVMGPRFRLMGEAVTEHKERLVWDLLEAGFTTTGPDGKTFFATDHPVIGADGEVASVANTDGGEGFPWFLIDDKRALKPIIFQMRKSYDLVAQDDPHSDRVFWKNQFFYGVHGRANVGFGFWQTAWGSKQTLDATTYAAARAGLMGLTGDYGRKLGIKPRLLVVGPSLEDNALTILNAEHLEGGASNIWKGTAELLVVPWLS